MDTKKDRMEEDLFNIVCGDLGLGETSRSNNYIQFEDLNTANGHAHNYLSVSDSCLHVERSNPCTFPEHSDEHATRLKCCYMQPCQNFHSHATDHSGLILKASLIHSDDLNVHPSVENFPTYADVPYGTSLRQQKKLYEQQIDCLKRQFAASSAEFETSKNNKDSKKSNSFKMTGKEIGKKLVTALQEMDELKIELDACRKRLDAKYKAVAILKQQAELADTELKNTEKKASETSRKLEQELSKLQFELEWRESSFIDSQQTWAERFDRVCQENAILMSKLEARNEELRRANAHKSALSRERDELLALLDVTERQKYEQGKSQIAEEDYGTFSSTELAVLGACKCRVSSPEPCGCAHAAANLRKEVAKLRDELECNQQRREEANLTVDAYRAAFEEQLARSKSMSTRLSQIATMSSRSAKAKAAIKWLIQVLNDDDYAPPQPIETAVEADKGHMLATMSLQELVTLLTEMLSEKNEALAHQKLAAQVLANKLQRYEKRERKSESDASTESRSKRSEGRPRKPQSVPNYKLDIYMKQDSTSDHFTDDEIFKVNGEPHSPVSFDDHKYHMSAVPGPSGLLLASEHRNVEQNESDVLDSESRRDENIQSDFKADKNNQSGFKADEINLSDLNTNENSQSDFKADENNQPDFKADENNQSDYQGDVNDETDVQRNENSLLELRRDESIEHSTEDDNLNRIATSKGETTDSLDKLKDEGEDDKTNLCQNRTQTKSPFTTQEERERRHDDGDPFNPFNSEGDQELPNPDENTESPPKDLKNVP
ncbi:unnamed protein product [Lymnaea stagnalis]|uniref:Uncharacterized protein n=1 Tax=Lymnaea stagnalis TaxID=6523 RepID=A0AAV2I9B6_LYMST